MMVKIVIDNIGTTLNCTAEQAARIHRARTALAAASAALTAECSALGPEHQAVKLANREYTAALADAGDPLAQML